MKPIHLVFVAALLGCGVAQAQLALPSAAGTASFTVDVTDTAGATLSQNYTITVISLIVSYPIGSGT